MIPIEVEEDVCRYEPSDNGAGPMWGFGNTCLVRGGETVCAAIPQTVPDARPLNNVRWHLYRRQADGWREWARGAGLTREPCPLACWPDGTVLLSDNPTLVPGQHGGAARPEVLRFEPGDPQARPQVLRPVWDGAPDFSEHSYRSFAADGANRELILFQNIGYDHAEWSFLDRRGDWSARGKLPWPWGGTYPVPQPIRVCYPSVALRDRAVYLFGVSDIVEPYPKWRTFKKELTGREWDYDFRRLFFTWSDDITTGKFHDWIEIASRDKTCGWCRAADLWVGPDGAIHLLWNERAIDVRLREKFFPGEKQSEALGYAVVRKGKIEDRRALHLGGEGISGDAPGFGRLHATPDGRLFVIYYLGGTDAHGKPLSENRIMEIRPGGEPGASVKVDLRHPFSSFYTATERAGCARSNVIDLLGEGPDLKDTIAYARVRVGGS